MLRSLETHLKLRRYLVVVEGRFLLEEMLVVGHELAVVPRVEVEVHAAGEGVRRGARAAGAVVVGFPAAAGLDGFEPGERQRVFVTALDVVTRFGVLVRRAVGPLVRRAAAEPLRLQREPLAVEGEAAAVAGAVALHGLDNDSSGFAGL